MLDKLAQYDDIYYRLGTYDLAIIKEVRSCYRLLTNMITSNDIVFDMGANIGSFSARFGKLCKKIVAYEPEPENFKLLQMNTKHLDNIVLVNAAVIHESDVTSRSLWINYKTIHRACHSLNKKRGRKEITINTCNFGYELRIHNPTLIKMDIEEAEYDLLDNTILPPSVRGIGMEFHLQTPETRARVDNTVKILEDQGFKHLKPFRYTAKAWNTLCFMER